MNKKNNNKGFTLVELIVVLVILAILAAILVPALLGYIDRAKGQQIVLNARSAYTAAQAEMTSLYAKDSDPAKIGSDPSKSRVIDTADVPCTALKIGVAGEYSKTADREEMHKAYTVNYVEYTEESGTVYLINGEWLSLNGDLGGTAPNQPESVKKIYTVK